MKRKKAIEDLATQYLKNLSKQERAEQLEIMMLEGWNENKDWNLLTIELQKEFDEGEILNEPSSPKYDEVLMIWLRENLQPVTNDFLKSTLGIESIEGEPIKLMECPCCGARTIEEKGNYEICKVCWWEDDGQDNESADKIYGGPNYGISLTEGRYNFIKFGIYDPNRKDLMKIKEQISKYERGRIFELVGNYVIEKGIDWKGKINK